MEDRKGFTIVELIVAVAILGVLTLIAIPSVRTIQNENKNTKYVTYQKALKAAAKAYVDSYDEDLFGSINSGCAKIPYSQFKEKELMEDIQVKDVDCGVDADTYVFVLKQRNKTHAYYANIVCRNGTTVVYSNQETTRTSCDIEDKQGPYVTITNSNPITDPIDAPYNNGKAGDTARYPSMKVIIEDKNTSTGAQAIGLRPDHQKLKYQWYKDGSKVDNSVSGSHGDLNVKVRDYYEPKASMTIPIPKDDMNVKEADARYSLKVFGTVEDMDGNTRTTTETNTTWIPTDYQPGSVGYEFEKRSKCPTYSWKQKNGSDASTSAWYNNDRNQISVTLNQIGSVISKFKANYYILKSSYKGAAFQDVNTHLVASPNPTLKVPSGLNGTYKYNVSYYKENGTKKYTCDDSDTYHFDHDDPSVKSFTLGAPGDAKTTDSHVAKYKGIDGHKNKITAKIECTDPTSNAYVVYRGTKQSNASVTKEETSHGSHSVTIYCIDSADNTSASQTKSDYVTYHANTDATHCGTYTDTCTEKVCQGGNVEHCFKLEKPWNTEAKCKMVEPHGYWSNGQCCHKTWDDCAKKVDHSYSCTKSYSCWY